MTFIKVKINDHNERGNREGVIVYNSTPIWSLNIKTNPKYVHFTTHIFLSRCFPSKKTNFFAFPHGGAFFPTEEESVDDSILNEEKSFRRKRAE